MRISRLANLVKELDDKSSRLAFIIDEDGLDNNKEYSKNYEDIGRKLIELHGLEKDYLHDQISKLVEIIYWMIQDENPNTSTSLDELYDLFFGLSDKEYNNAKEKLLKMISKDKHIETSYKFQDYNMSNTIAEDIEEPEFFNIDTSKWRRYSDDLITYEFNKNREALHGILIPNELYEYFDISEEDVANSNIEDCRIIHLHYRKKLHECYILGSKDKSSVYLYWVQRDFRKKLLKRYPEYFTYTGYNEDSTDIRRVYIIFDKRFKKSNNFYSIDFDIK